MFLYRARRRLSRAFAPDSECSANPIALIDVATHPPRVPRASGPRRLAFASTQ
ncbi:conserved hypothetical protein [Burkholderia pseudomallei 576]|nr:conserved hypothetical protein [Burkholderia pseudomallei 576]